MKISELEEKLKAIKTEVGDIECRIYGGDEPHEELRAECVDKVKDFAFCSGDLDATGLVWYVMFDTAAPQSLEGTRWDK